MPRRPRDLRAAVVAGVLAGAALAALCAVALGDLLTGIARGIR